MAFADRVNVLDPTMGEKASGHFKIDSSVRSSDVYFLVNESNPKCYAEQMIERFIDTSRLIGEEIAKRYRQLSVTFYHRGNLTDELFMSKSTKILTLCENDLISEYHWRDGQPRDTVFYDHGMERGAENIKLDDMRFKKKNDTTARGY